MKTNFMMAAIIVILSLISNLGFGQYSDMNKLLYQDNSSFNKRVMHYPNPTKNVLTFQDLKENTTITFYNTLGQQVKSVFVKAGGNAVIDVSNLRNGKYYLELCDKEKYVKEITYLQILR